MNRIFAKQKNDDPEHPGLILQRAMKDHNMTPLAFAKAIGISKMELEKLFDGKTSITRATAGKFGRYFGNGSGAWINMQALWDERKT
ncbi:MULTISPECIES: HigA family addiction module antitoxin [unclassified Lentilitoribacter]|jgi:addiction module HigA family antidote|uniref:HigA family addiction module antitoxin n=1 Tax=unclassified Lentilitoribacter TaxID=2647570 RepID=UPI0013A6965A|nr:HigA family addiction module antitoxin [Lentilitoribacter sp. Alg239-R112]